MCRDTHGQLPAWAPEESVQGLRHGPLPAHAPEGPLQGGRDWLRRGLLKWCVGRRPSHTATRSRAPNAPQGISTGGPISGYGWMPHNAGFDFLDPTPSILLLRQLWD